MDKHNPTTWLILVLAGLACLVSAPAYGYDFSLGISGPQHVVRANSIYLLIESALLEGDRDYVFYYVAGLPEDSSVSYPYLDKYCCGGNRAWAPGDTLLKIDIAATAPKGSYLLTLSAESGGVTKETTHGIQVDAVPASLPKTPIDVVPPIPGFTQWEANMTAKGGNLCDEADILNKGLWEGNIWYYDGIRVYYQIADYTNDDSWNACAGYVKNVYRPYVLDNNGAIPGWRLFPHGLCEDYLKTGAEDSRDAVILMSQNSAYASHGGGVDPALVRETAYLIHAYRIAQLLGAAEHENYLTAVDFALGHIDQWFVSKTEPYMQPFMVGLASEALIQYHEETKDPRIPPVIKIAMDGIWDWAWIPEDKAFFYESTGDTSSGAPDLNLLIAPAYAWLYRMTGDPVYQERGDLIFEGGVEGAWLDQGKQFSQNYRWSFDFVRWRLNPDPCENDADGDGDVDGMDLYNLTTGFTLPDLVDFALDYGRNNCAPIRTSRN
jgi:hypothetical protein